MDSLSPLCVHFCSSCKDYIEGRKISHLICLGFDPGLQAFQNWALPTALLRRSAYFIIMQQIIRVVINLVPVELVRSEFVNLYYLRCPRGHTFIWPIYLTNLFISFRENNTRQTKETGEAAYLVLCPIYGEVNMASLLEVETVGSARISRM